MSQVNRVTSWLYTIVVVFAANIANADPLTFFYDSNAFNAAASGLQVGPYPLSTETSVFKMGAVQFVPAFSIATVATSSTSTLFTPQRLQTGSSFAVTTGFCIPGPLGCTFTALDLLDINFASPIVGLQGNLFLNTSGEIITLNGQNINPTGGINAFYNGFFGALGQISTLEFDCPTCDYTDNPAEFRLTLVAGSTVVPEPASIAILGAALAGIGLLRRRVRYHSNNLSRAEMQQ